MHVEITCFDLLNGALNRSLMDTHAYCVSIYIEKHYWGLTVRKARLEEIVLSPCDAANGLSERRYKPGHLANPASHGRTVDIDALTRIDI